MTKRTVLECALSVALLGAGASVSSALPLYVVNSGVQGNVGVTTAVAHLTALGHTVTTGGTLADYTSYDQVWDLRYNQNFVLDDLTAFSSYLASGGRLYLTGENPTFDAQRNVSLRGLLFALGAGDTQYSSAVASNSQSFTAEGGALNVPNAFASVEFLGARSVSTPGSGFLVTESTPGAGSMVAWDFGDIAGAPSARMIALWDIDVFRGTLSNGVNWVENLVTYLDGDPTPTIPEPAPFALLLSGGLAAFAARGRRLTASPWRTALHRTRRGIAKEPQP